MWARLSRGGTKREAKGKKNPPGMRSNPCATGSKSLRGEEGGCFELFGLFIPFEKKKNPAVATNSPGHWGVGYIR